MKSLFKFFKTIMILALFSFSIFITSSYAVEEVIKTDDGNFYIGNNSDEVESYGYKLETNDYGIALLSTDANSGSQTYNITDTITGTISNGTFTITGTGKMPDYKYSYNVPWGGDTSITKLVISNGITSIGKYNFIDLSSLKELSLPNTITSIGEGAFYGCSSLTSITIPSKVTEIKEGAFVNCSSITTINLNEGLKTIETYAFQGTAIKTLTIPSTVTSIGFGIALFANDVAEYKVASGNSIYFTSGGALCEDNPSITNVYIIAYPPANTAETYEIPARVNDISQHAFQGAKNLKKITVHSNVEAIRAYAFSDCESLEEVIIEKCDLFFFGPSVFADCPKLKKVEMGVILTNTYYPVDRLQYHTFANCTSLETVNFTGEVGIIYNQAFENCTSLKTITLSKTTKEICENAFLDCTALEKVIWDDTLKKVQKNAFNGCTNLIEKYPNNFELYSDGFYREKSIDIDLTGTYYYSKAKEVLNLVNQERAKQGLSSLYMDTGLFDTANQRAAECAVLYSHTRPDGTDFFYIFPSGNYYMLENIAIGQTTAQAVMNSWMNSSGHRANILDASVKSIGISCFYHNGVYYWVQCFGIVGTNKTSYPSDSSKQVTVSATMGKITFSIESNSLSVRMNNTASAKVYGRHADSAYSKFICDNSTFDWKASNTGLFTVSSNGIVSGKKLGSGSLTMAAPNSQSFNISVSVKLPFTDIKDNVWYTNALEYTYTNGFVSGTTSTTFSPNMELSRAMLVCILWNIEGKPNTTAGNKFSDVKNNVWYTDAIKWASSKGIINGYKNGTFGPNDPITREQLACILANYAKYKKCYVGSDISLGKYLDNNLVSSWAVTSVKWAVANGVINGTNNGTMVSPVNSASRAEAITMIKNYIDKIK